MQSKLFLSALVVLAAAVLASAAPAWFSVVQTGGQYSVVDGKVANSYAEAYYDAASVSENGWATLGLYTRRSQTAPANQKAYAAGFLEGFISAELIWPSFQSTMASAFESTSNIPADTAKFLRDNIAWTKSMVSANSGNPYWTRVGYTMQMMQGIVDGYNAATTNEKQKLTLLDVWVMNSDGDLEEISVVTDIKNLAWMRGGKRGLPVKRQPLGSHCSVLVKVTNDLSNLFLGHVTWEDFVEMLRIYKVYDLDFYGTRVSFSSYPATLTSIDDFYVTSNKLAITETTNGIFTQELYSQIKPQALFSWVRAWQSNVASTSCAQWMSIFGQYNSGTYNNQWICADYNLFTPGHSLKPGTLWIGEQIPGQWVTADKTDTLSYGYWPSYNVPFFPEIYNKSGFGQQPNYDDFFSYSLCPRAKIFRRDHHKVTDIKSMQQMMRYNDWQNDPFSNGNPCNQISSRCDLVKGTPSNPDTQLSAFGSVDGKIVDYKSIQHTAAWAQSGPTYDQQPAFTWDNSLWQDQPHGGQPQTFKFPWVYMYAQFP